MNPGTIAFKPVPAFLHHPQQRLVWLKPRSGLWAGRKEMPTESGQWDCCQLGCPSIPLGSQERTGNSGVISSRGPVLREMVGHEGIRLG